MRRVVRGTLDSVALALVTLAAATVAGPSRADDAAIVRNLKYYCGTLTDPGSVPLDRALLRCDTVQDDPDIFKMVMDQQVPQICQSIQEQCQAPGTEARKARLSTYLTTLSCASRGYTCLSGGRATGRICDQGDINLVVQTIEGIERAGGAVSIGLRRAVRTYSEVCAVNRATQAALANVNTELRAFYDDRYVGCIEAGFEGPVNECTAAIDRRWQANAVRAMFDWRNANSIVTQVTLDTVRRWTGTDK